MKIKELILFSANIQKQKQFYSEVLEFELVLETAEKIAFKIGESILCFQYKKEVKSSHVAFNIPTNLVDETFNWLQKRVDILDYQGTVITSFEKWNAKAIYFYDADKNIMEFIARKELNVESNKPFSPSELISISEMAIATDNLESIYNTINAMKPIPIFDGNLSRFCALGNDEGLFILIDKTKKKWYPTMEEAFTSDFIIKGDYNFKFEDGKILKLT
jgi:catechol 2,3-dioxygenase-like lactoylglutathione lyase family enzyme